jgi:hypothetical protein
MPPRAAPFRPLPELNAAPTPPPFRLLAAHFLLVITSLTLGSAGVLAIAPRLAVGDFLSPHVLATVHLFTLGVLLAAISGVLHQFYPMALGWALRSRRVAAAGVTLLILGVASVVTGFWFWMPWLLATGWVLIFGAVGCVSWNLLPARRRVPNARLVGGFVSAGHVALGLAMLLAAGRIGEFLHWWTMDRLGTIAAHYHLAALGFGTLTAVGVGSRMLPMFLVSHGAPTKPVPWEWGSPASWWAPPCTCQCCTGWGRPSCSPGCCCTSPWRAGTSPAACGAARTQQCASCAWPSSTWRSQR